MPTFKSILEEKAENVGKDLLQCFEKNFDAPDNIVSAMKYSLFAGGKRIRPILMRETCALMGGDPDSVKELSCAIEMIHTYSLIHDDLPAMDNDDLRRGKPTNHKVYGEDIAILAGDALLNFAVETALSGIQRMTDPDRLRGIQALSILMNASGVNGMVGGQTGDLLIEDDNTVDESKLEYVHTHKTGALIKAPVVCGAVMAGASEEDTGHLKDYGEALGMAFQIADDILDVIGETKTLGKPVGSDEKNHKTTYVSLYGMASAQEILKQNFDKSLTALSSINRNTQFLAEMAEFVCKRAM